MHGFQVMKKLIVMCFVFLAACSGVSHVPPSPTETVKKRPEPTLPPMSREKEIGRQFIKAALKEYEFVRDYEVVAQVNRVGKEILRAIGEDPSEFHFFVVRQNQLNAFAVPGGYIFMFDGLLKQLKTEEALAGVLAHEIAHVQRNHFFKDEKKMNAINLATMASIILAGLTGESVGATGTIAAAANISMQLKFSRENEEEADLFALRYLRQTEYNPSGLADFFDTLSFYAGFTSGAEPPYFSTHPGLRERRFMVETLMKDFPSKKKLSDVSSESWRRDWGRAAAILQAKDAENTALSETTDELSPSQMARRFYLSGLSALRGGRLQEASRDYQAAIEREPEKAIYHADLAYVWMQLQEAPRAKASALESIRLSGNSPTPYLVLGMIAQSEQDHKAAVKELEAALNRAPEDAFIHLQLARSYHALSIPAKEKFHLGRYHRLNLEPEKAILQFQNALTLLDEQSPLAFAADREIEEMTRDGV